MKSLVVYFSRGDENYGVGTVEVGNTEFLAKEIVAKIGADEFKIIPKEKYPDGYMETVELATKEKETNARPEYVGEVDISEYDVIFLGYPIWWGDLPMIVYSFLEKHDFAGKTVIPFCTHEGSGEAGTFESLKEKLSGATVLSGIDMTGTAARTEEGARKMDKFLESLDLGAN